MAKAKQLIHVRTTQVGTQNGLHVTATVRGDWATHPSIARKGWSVTHVPTGCAAVFAATAREATRIARALQEAMLPPFPLAIDFDCRKLPQRGSKARRAYETWGGLVMAAIAKGIASNVEK